MALREVLSSAATAMLTTLRAVLPSQAATALHWAQALQLGAQRSLAEPGDLVPASELEAWRQLEEFRADLAARLTPMSRICACRGEVVHVGSITSVADAGPAQSGRNAIYLSVGVDAAPRDLT